MRTKYTWIILLLALFPIKIIAQTSVSQEYIDTVQAREAAAGSAGSLSDAYTGNETAPPPHTFYDQAIPVTTDSLDEDTYYRNLLLPRKVPAQTIKELRDDPKLKYEKKKITETSPWLYILIGYLVRFISSMYLIIIAVAVIIFGVMLYVFLKKNGYLSAHKKSKVDMNVELSDEDLDIAAYEKEIHTAVTAGKLRLAVRLLYLQTLRLLADKEIIAFSKEKTNAAYLRAMAQTSWYKTFANLTLDYEYTWYGEVPLNEEQFSLIQKHFRQFMNDLGYTR